MIKLSLTEDLLAKIRVGEVASKFDHFENIVVLEALPPHSITLQNANRGYSQKIDMYIRSIHQFDGYQDPPKRWRCPLVTYATRNQLINMISAPNTAAVSALPRHVTSDPDQPEARLVTPSSSENDASTHHSAENSTGSR